VSKYARQIFQAMRPVFTDWAAEVQRSLGFYTSSNTEVKLTRVIAMGGGTKLRGLCKYLQQSLEIPVEKPEAFKRLPLAEGLSAAKFHDNVADFGVVYGLATQGVGMGRIESNLLPGSVVRSMAWANKTRYFMVAAVMILVSGLLCLGRVGMDRIAYARAGDVRNAMKGEAARADGIVKSASSKADEKRQFEAKMQKAAEAFKYREVVPELYQMILSAVPDARNNPDQAALYDAYARGDLATVQKTPRIERKQLFLTEVSMYYSTDLANAEFGETASSRRATLLQQVQMEQQADQGAAAAAAHYREANQSSRGGPRGATTTATTVTGDQGFVITVKGYSPYGKNIMTLVQPVGAVDDPKKWGFVQRLEHPDKIADMNSPFQLYSMDSKHLKIETGIVDTSDKVPEGVGVFVKAAAVRSATAGAAAPADKQILVDAITREIISCDIRQDGGKDALDQFRQPIYDKERDYWFVVSFKLKWKDAPGAAAAAQPGR